MSESRIELTGALKDVFDISVKESKLNFCSEIYTETFVYNSIKYCIDNKFKVKGGEITCKLLKKLSEEDQEDLLSKLKKISRKTMKEHKIESSLIFNESLIISKNLDSHLNRIRSLKTYGLLLTKPEDNVLDDFILSILYDDDNLDYVKELIIHGFSKQPYVSSLFETISHQVLGVNESKADEGKISDDDMANFGKFLESMGFGDLAKSLGFPGFPTGSSSDNDSKEGSGSGEYNSEEFEKAGQVKDIHTKKTDPNSSTPALDEFGINMTQLAKDGKYDKVIGREKEVNQIIEILCCRKKNNAMVIGKAGAGKTALIEYLAQKISNDDVPNQLKGKKIISLSVTTLTAGCMYRGQLEQRIQDVCKEATNNRNIILVVDEFHAAVSEGSSDISQMLKPGLSRGELTLIAMTTYDEYKKYIEKDGALKRRFQKVYIEEPSKEETFEILKGLKEKYSEYHGVEYSDDILMTCVRLSEKYLYDRNSPDRAIDLMDVSGARAKLERPIDSSREKALVEKIEKVKEKKVKYLEKEDYDRAADERSKQKELETRLEELKATRKKTEVTPEDVATVVSELVNVPIEKILSPDIDKLRSMSETLKGRIIGQDECIEVVTKLLSKQFLGLRDENIPPSLYISGGTGTGKTYLAEEIAKTIFGSEKAMLRIDCGELSQPHTVTKLIGAPPSYVGFGEVALFDKVRERPQQLILVDEADKLCDEILNTIFLNILTTGFITLSNGIEVSFKDCIFIFTSNDGTRELEAHGKGIGFGLEDKKAMTKEIVMKAIKKRIRPEVINRFSGIVIFNSLGKEEMKKIYVLELKKLADRLKGKGFTLTVSDSVRDKIISELDLNYGARDLSRGIAKWVEDPICDKLLEESTGGKSKVDVNLDKEEKVCVKFKK